MLTAQRTSSAVGNAVRTITAHPETASASRSPWALPSFYNTTFASSGKKDEPSLLHYPNMHDWKVPPRSENVGVQRVQKAKGPRQEQERRQK